MSNRQHLNFTKGNFFYFFKYRSPFYSLFSFISDRIDCTVSNFLTSQKNIVYKNSPSDLSKNTFRIFHRKFLTVPKFLERIFWDSPGWFFFKESESVQPILFLTKENIFRKIPIGKQEWSLFHISFGSHSH